MAAEVYLGLLVCLVFCFETTTAEWGSPAFYAPDPQDRAVLYFDSSNSIRTNIELEEEITYNVTIAQVNYTGTDEPVLGRFESSKSNLLLGAVFAQDNLGVWQLVITKTQDYETEVMQNYRFEVSAGDQIQQIALNIINIDDNAPVIQAYNTSCSVEENWSGLTDCGFLISDADGWIDQVTFSITATPSSGDNAFSMVSFLIESTTLQKHAYLQVEEELDYETITMYLLYITARDGAGNEGYASYIVQVIDMPDEPPTWTNIFSAANIEEKSTEYFQVSAIDGDFGINADISYAIIASDNEDQYFEVNSTTGLITINPIDRDALAMEVFRFIIVAYETEDLESSINSTIIIIVEDINDHSPEISPDELSIAILEETYMTLSFNESIVISDPDLAENAQFTVQLTDDSEFGWSSAFLIIPTSGYQSGVFTISVVNASLLDYEDEDWRSINIQIVATEVANTSHIGIRNIMIDLINWNDEYPIFENASMTVEVPEDVEMGFFIATMLATDRDVGDEVTHAIVSQRTLSIDPLTAEITTAQDGALDYETVPVVIVQVTATDLGSHIVYATLTINVIDVNDVPPTLTMPRTNPSIYEEVDIGSVVNTTIYATDVDTDAFLIFSIDWSSSYAYKSGVIVNEEEYLETLEIKTSYPENNTLYAEGTLEVSGRLDFEMFDVMYLTIVVTDMTTVHNDNSTSALLTLLILDINDNPPLFESYVDMSVTENQVTNTLIGSVQATDADGPGNNDVTYSIEPVNGTASDLVWINMTTGVIRVDENRAIDAEAPYEYLYYTVYATDGVHITPLNIEIYVIDQNDEVPELVTGEFNTTLYLREKSGNGEDIVTVVALDRDRTSPYNNVSYLINNDYSLLFQYFSMTKYTGELVVSLSDGYILDRDFGTSNFTVFLVIRDNFLDEGVTWNSNALSTSVSVILTDINDQIPELPELSDPAATVSENSQADQLILTVVAVDYDEPNTDNTRVFYEIHSVKPQDNTTVLDEDCSIPFRVETRNDADALIYTNCSLKGYYGIWAVELYAEDLGTDPSSQNDTKIYNIFIEDYNYNDPVITYPVTNRSIRLSRTQTTNSQLNAHDLSLLSDFTATDADSGLSGTIEFSLTGSEAALEYFTIVETGTNSAQLQLSRIPTDLENYYTYEIEITVTDNGTPSRKTTQTNTVYFISTEGPEFEDNEWTAWFKENTTGLGDSVTIPEAWDMVNIDTDEDLVPIYYFFTNTEGDMSYFSLDSVSRNLTLTSILDRESRETLTLYVVATSSSEGAPASPREQATLNITIIVLDVNDNPPSFASSSYFGGVSPEDALDKVILTVVATDPDLNETLTYYLEDDTITHSDASISSIIDPFKMNSETGELTLQFIPLSSMAGYFDFIVSVYDAVNHTDTTNVKVYVIAESNRVEFTFENTVVEITDETAFLISSFSSAFGYICNVDDVSRALADDGITSMDNETIVTTHFIDENTNLPVTSDLIILASNDLQTITELKVNLLTRSLRLIDVPSGSSTTISTANEIIQSVLIVLCVILFICCVALLTAYIIKTKRLNDRLDKLAVTKFGSQSSGLNRIGVVPTTNKFALEGSNPMWNTQEKIPEDRVSQYSNDSDLIGIENHPNFSYSNNGMAVENNWPEEERRGSINPVIANQMEARRDSRNPLGLQHNMRKEPITEL